jgi:hypothetical protein
MLKTKERERTPQIGEKVFDKECDGLPPVSD